jgi:phenylacetate-CoA ligase
MSEKNINKYIERWNKARPCLVLAYTTSMFEFARFIERNGVTIHTPKVIVCSAEVLSEEVRTYIEKVMHAPVLNQYGSREVSLIACECPAKQGLHVFSLFNKVEILDSALNESAPGIMGDVVVTNLVNYSMPLIRYQIGDTAMNAVSRSCTCGRNWPLIAAITGRKSDHLCHKNGTLVHGEYFTHLFYNRPDIEQFQVIQRDYEKVEVLIVPRTSLTEHTRNDIIEKIRLVLGGECDVFFNVVDHIPRTASGKYRYTVSEVTIR